VKIEIVKVDSLTPDPENAREHSDRNIEAIKKSMAKFGQQKPIVISEDNVILAGNGFWTAAKALGWEDIAAVRSTLEGAKATAYAIADNKTGELGGWDYDRLADQMREFNRQLQEATGFADFEMESLLKEDWEAPEPSDAQQSEGGGSAATEWLGRFILTYRDETEKQMWMERLGMDGKKQMYDAAELI